MSVDKIQNYLAPNWNNFEFSTPAASDSSNLSIWNSSIPNLNFNSTENIFNFPMQGINSFGTGNFNFPMQGINSFGTGNFNFSMPAMNFNNFDWQAGLDQAVQMQNKYMQNYFDNMKSMYQKLIANQNTNTPTTPTADYGNYNFNVATTKYEGSARDLNKHLDGVLKGKGKTLLKLQEKYGINAAFLAALVNHESANGKSNAAQNKNNVAGIMSAESNFTELRTFKNVDECLEYLAKLLSESYVSQGLVTISQIHSKYCPIGAQNDPNGLNANWGSSINALTNRYMADA